MTLRPARSISSFSSANSLLLNSSSWRFAYFEGANQVADVHLNGEHLGRHVGGYTAFAFELTPHLRCDGRSFQHLLCVEGAGTLQSQGGESSFAKGNSFFLPAALGEYTITGACRVLISRIGKDEQP